MTIRAFRRRGPGYLPTAQVFDVLRREGMTRSEVARQVRVTVDELYAAIFGLVVTRRRARAAKLRVV
jgi:hypothetical protein